MSTDELQRAFRALREETDGASNDASDTLERVLITSHTVARRPFRAAKLWIPIAAVLIGSTAWAAASGRLDPLWSETSEPPEPAPVLPALAMASAASVESLPTSMATLSIPDTASSIASSSALSMASAESVASAGPSVSPSALRTSSSSLPSASVARARGLTSGAAPSASVAVQNPLAADKADFEAAYRVHASSSAQDSASAQAAVVAWNQYLARHPDGRFVPEARYARAVALARAGHRNEAREALQSFAKGEPGSYRRDDALELLEAIEP